MGTSRTPVRRARRDSDRQDRTTTRYVQDSKRSGSRRLGKLSPHGDQRLLDGIVGTTGVSDDPVRDAVQAASGRPGKGLVGVAVAVLRPLDQFPIHQ